MGSLIRCKGAGVKTNVLINYWKWYRKSATPPNEYPNPSSWVNSLFKGYVQDVYSLIGLYGQPLGAGSFDGTSYHGLGTFLYSPINQTINVIGEADDYNTLYVDGVLALQWHFGSPLSTTLNLSSGWHRYELTCANTETPGATIFWGTTGNQAVTSISGIIIDAAMYTAWTNLNW